MLLYQNDRDRFWSPTQEAAAAHKREIGGSFNKVEVPSVGRDALADFLNHIQADAALDVEIAWGLSDEQIRQSNTPEAQAAAREAMRPKADPLEFDDAWEGFSLQRKLHFAALAMEEARSAL